MTQKNERIMNRVNQNNMHPYYNSIKRYMSAMGYVVYEPKETYVKSKPKKTFSHCLQCKRTNIEIRGPIGGVHLNDYGLCKRCDKKMLEWM